MHLPIYDPDTLLLLTIFADTSKGRLFSHGPPQLVGKLRVRLSTVAADRQHQCSLPMLPERKKGGGYSATAHLGLKVRAAACRLCSSARHEHAAAEPAVWPCIAQARCLMLDVVLESNVAVCGCRQIC